MCVWLYDVLTPSFGDTAVSFSGAEIKIQASNCPKGKSEETSSEKIPGT